MWHYMSYQLIQQLEILTSQKKLDRNRQRDTKRQKDTPTSYVFQVRVCHYKIPV